MVIRPAVCAAPRGVVAAGWGVGTAAAATTAAGDPAATATAAVPAAATPAAPPCVRVTALGGVPVAPSGCPRLRPCRPSRRRRRRRLRGPTCRNRCRRIHRTARRWHLLRTWCPRHRRRRRRTRSRPCRRADRGRTCSRHHRCHRLRGGRTARCRRRSTRRRRRLRRPAPDSPGRTARPGHRTLRHRRRRAVRLDERPRGSDATAGAAAVPAAVARVRSPCRCCPCLQRRAGTRCQARRPGWRSTPPPLPPGPPDAFPPAAPTTVNLACSTPAGRSTSAPGP